MSNTVNFYKCCHYIKVKDDTNQLTYSLLVKLNFLGKLTQK